MHCTHHVGSFGACDRKFEVGILLPIAEEERKLGKEPVVNISNGGYGLGAGVAIDAALKRFAGAHKLLPSLIAIGIFVLLPSQPSQSLRLVNAAYHFDKQLSQLGAVLAAATEDVHLDAGIRALLVSMWSAPFGLRIQGQSQANVERTSYDAYEESRK